MGADGGVVGRIADLIARPAGEADLPVADQAVLSRRGKGSVVVPLGAVDLVHPHHLRLNDDVSDLPSFATESLADDAILLVRDVLDSQVIDIAGQRVTRVADVVLARRHDGRIEVVGVEVGFDAVLRRLGMDWVAEPMRRDAIAWTDLHLMSDRGHTVQLATPRSAIHRLDVRGLATLVTRLASGPAAEILDSQDTNTAADVVRASHPFDAERMLRAMPASKSADIVAAMPIEHARHWTDRLSRSPRRQRHLLRSGVWPRRRPGAR
ncbi:cation transporter [Methanocella arvoryzae MRE50] [Mycolicibacterium parafortuitum]|uniref:Cation transporter [Methanocella arvoryzae MRE50] n=1 Tax=Mycolicibacterium parafortuitum TaxID=39692 RepID=A0A375YMT7_MYCPF|nr:cation transporter [Methanocella arvoryzae MRE50] [Mycolicibacterium parafortuitum]